MYNERKAREGVSCTSHRTEQAEREVTESEKQRRRKASFPPRARALAADYSLLVLLVGVAGGGLLVGRLVLLLEDKALDLLDDGREAVLGVAEDVLGTRAHRDVCAVRAKGCVSRAGTCDHLTPAQAERRSRDAEASESADGGRTGASDLLADVLGRLDDAVKDRLGGRLGVGGLCVRTQDKTRQSTQGGGAETGRVK